MQKFKKIIFTFLAVCQLLCPVSAQSLGLESPQSALNMVIAKPVNSFVLLQGVKINPVDPFVFELLFDSGAKISQEEFSRQVEYFLACLTLPESDLWVNLSPYDPGRICTPELGKTALGEGMLGQDYLLKNMAASLTSPQSRHGKTYWDELLSKGYSAQTFNKVWITSGKSLVYEHKGTAVIKKASLRVLTDVDYKAAHSNGAAQDSNSAANQAFKEHILPMVQKQIDNAEEFRQLRQIYQAFILASWFKKKLKESIFQYFLDQKKIGGIVTGDEGFQEKIYQAYLKAFKDGAYNYVKKDYNPLRKTLTKRQYFSGGVVMSDNGNTTQPVSAQEVAESTRGLGSAVMEFAGTGKKGLGFTGPFIVLVAAAQMAYASIASAAPVLTIPDVDVSAATDEPQDFESKGSSKASLPTSEESGEPVLSSAPIINSSVTLSKKNMELRPVRPPSQIVLENRIKLSGAHVSDRLQFSMADLNGHNLRLGINGYGSNGGYFNKGFDGRYILPLGSSTKFGIDLMALNGHDRRDSSTGLILKQGFGCKEKCFFFANGSMDRRTLYNSGIDGNYFRAGLSTPAIVLEGFGSNHVYRYHWSGRPEDKFAYNMLGAVLGFPGIDSYATLRNYDTTGRFQFMGNIAGRSLNFYYEDTPSAKWRETQIDANLAKLFGVKDRDLVIVYNHGGINQGTPQLVVSNAFGVGVQSPIYRLKKGNSEKGEKDIDLSVGISGRYIFTGEGFDQKRRELFGNITVTSMASVGWLYEEGWQKDTGLLAPASARIGFDISPTNIYNLFFPGHTAHWGLGVKNENRFDRNPDGNLQLRDSKTTVISYLPHNTNIWAGLRYWQLFGREKYQFTKEADFSTANLLLGGNIFFDMPGLNPFAGLSASLGEGGSVMVDLGFNFDQRPESSSKKRYDSGVMFGPGRLSRENFDKALSNMGGKSPNIDWAKFSVDNPQGAGIGLIEMGNFVRSIRGSQYSGRIQMILHNFYGINIAEMDPNNLSSTDQADLAKVIFDPELQIRPGTALDLFECGARLYDRALANPKFRAEVAKSGADPLFPEKKDFTVILVRDDNGKKWCNTVNGRPHYGFDDTVPSSELTQPKDEKKPEVKPGDKPSNKKNQGNANLLGLGAGAILLGGRKKGNKKGDGDGNNKQSSPNTDLGGITLENRLTVTGDEKILLRVSPTAVENFKTVNVVTFNILVFTPK